MNELWNEYGGALMVIIALLIVGLWAYGMVQNAQQDAEREAICIEHGFMDVKEINKSPVCIYEAPGVFLALPMDRVVKNDLYVRSAVELEGGNGTYVPGKTE